MTTMRMLMTTLWPCIRCRWVLTKATELVICTRCLWRMEFATLTMWRMLEFQANYCIVLMVAIQFHAFILQKQVSVGLIQANMCRTSVYHWFIS